MDNLHERTPRSPEQHTERSQVSAVIVSYNTADLIVDAIESLRRQTPAPAEIIVVDNASTDGSVELLRERFAACDDVRLVESGTNCGFARAVNLGAAVATGDALLLFNPDARLDAGSLQSLLDVRARRPDAGLVGAAVRFPDGRLNRTTARPLPTVWSLACHGLLLTHLRPGSKWFDPDRLPPGDLPDEVPVEMLSGVCVLVDRALWDRLDGFDERFWLYGEDADLSHRALGAGAQPILVTTATVEHAPGSSSPDSAKKLAWMRCGDATYLRKHWSGARLRFGLSMLWIGSALRAASHRLRPRADDTDWVAMFGLRHRWLAGYGPGPHDRPPW